MKPFLKHYSLLYGVLKSFPDALETTSKRGMGQTAEGSNLTTCSSWAHGCPCLNTPKLFSFAQRQGYPSRQPNSALVQRTTLERADRKVAQWSTSNTLLVVHLPEKDDANALKEEASGKWEAAAPSVHLCRSFESAFSCSQWLGSSEQLHYNSQENY